MNVPVKLELLTILGLLISLMIIGLLHSLKFDFSSRLNRPTVTTMPNKMLKIHKLLKPIEMRRIVYDDVEDTTEGVVTAADERYMGLIRSRMTEPDTTRPRALDPPYDKAQGAGQLGQPPMINNRLKGRNNGFFVECGAHNGQSMSNSLFFEMEKNWTGLLIEPQPEYHAALLRRNRKVYTLNACISHTGRPQQASFVPFGSRGVTKQDNVTTKKIKLTSVKRRIQPFHAQVPTIPVMCFPLNDILTAINVTHVDYLSLDIDGLEADVLETLNWKKIRIDIMTVEFNHNMAKLERLRKLMKIEGYREVGQLSVDVVFEREEK